MLYSFCSLAQFIQYNSKKRIISSRFILENNFQSCARFDTLFSPPSRAFHSRTQLRLMMVGYWMWVRNPVYLLPVMLIFSQFIMTVNFQAILSVTNCFCFHCKFHESGKKNVINFSPYVPTYDCGLINQYRINAKKPSFVFYSKHYTSSESVWTSRFD